MTDSTSRPDALPMAPNASAPPPPPPDDAPVEVKDEYWLRHIYQGDRVKQLTLRAVVMGAIIGMFMSISNLYTHLKLGWGFGVAITSCVVSYVVWNALRGLTVGRLSRMTILENACMASTSSAAGYATGNTLPMAFGALILLDGKHTHPWWIVMAFTFFAAAVGVFVAVPMKRQMINAEQLKFPSGTAAAETLRSLYSEGKEALQKAYSLIIALGAGVIVGFLRSKEGDVKRLDEMFAWVHSHMFNIRLKEVYNFDSSWLGLKNLHAKGFGYEPSVLLIGAGMLVGLRVSLSLLAGSVLLYFVVGPWLLRVDEANAGVEGFVRSIDIVADGTQAHFYKWAVWGGSAAIMFASLTSLALQWRTIARAFRVFGGNAAASRSVAALRRVDVPLSWMVIGLIPTGAGLVTVLHMGFGVAIWLGIVAVLLSFVISLACSRATGETDTTPTGAMGKVTQLLYAILPGAAGNVHINLVAAGAMSGAGLSSADLLTDLKTGYLLGANPRKQFLAQFIGCFFGTIAVIPAWYLMVPTREALERFDPPAVNIWFSVAKALSDGLGSLPYSAKVSIAIGAILGVTLPLISYLAPKSRPYLPSVIGLGLSWAMPFYNGFSFALGAIIAAVWTKMHKRSAGVYNVPIASGLIAGESIILALIAIAATLTMLDWAQIRASLGF